MGGRGTLYRPVTLESAATAGLVGAQKDVDMLYSYLYGRACQRRPILRLHRAEPWVRFCDVSVLYSCCSVLQHLSRKVVKDCKFIEITSTCRFLLACSQRCGPDTQRDFGLSIWNLPRQCYNSDHHVLIDRDLTNMERVWNFVRVILATKMHRVRVRRGQDV
jgi:hypothetical protein